MLVPCDTWDTGAMEQWLEEQAALGWRVALLGVWFAVFQAAEPAACRVRLEPCQTADPGRREEQKALYRELGWTCRAEIGDYLVFYCDDPGVPELQTDPTAQGWAWERTLRFQWRFSLFMAVWLLLISLQALGYLGDIRETPVEWFLFRSGWKLVLALLLTGPMIWGSLKQFRAAERVRRQLSAGVAPPHTGNWRRGLRRRRAALPAVAALALFTLLSLAGDLARYPTPIAWAKGPLPYVAASELAPAMEGDGGFYMERKGFLAKRVDITQSDGNGRTVRTVHTQLAVLAKPLYRETLEGLLAARPADAVAELTAPGLDRAVLLTGRDGQILLARRGGVILQVRTTGVEGLEDHLDDYAALLAEH